MTEKNCPNCSPEAACDACAAAEGVRLLAATHAAKKKKKKKKAAAKRVASSKKPAARKKAKRMAVKREISRQERAQQEIYKRELEKRHLLAFVQRFEPAYQAGWVHKVICAELMAFSEQVVRGEAPRLMITMPPRHGKQNSLRTQVLTPTGWRRFGDLRPGDEVFHPSGRPVEVLALSEDSMTEYDVEFSNGQVIKCHGNHEWAVYDRSRHDWRTAETKYLGSQEVFSKGRSRFQLPAVSALEFPRQELQMHPYVLGAWLGDGTATAAAVTHAPGEVEVIAAIATHGYPPSRRQVHRDTGVITTGFGFTGMMAEIRAMKVWGNKHIPDIYKRSSIEQRLELLAGLIDSDGSVCRKTSRVRFINTNKRLVDDVVDIATTLGFRPYVSEVEPCMSSSGIRGKQVVYTVGFQPTMNIPTQLPRKKVKRFAKQRRIGIVGIRRTEKPELGRCIQVDSPDGLYLVGEKLIPTHNSLLASQYFPAWHLGRNPSHEFINTSYAQSLQMDFSRKIQELVKSEDYHHLFGNLGVTKKNEAIERWSLYDFDQNKRTGGGILAAGVGGPITGRGCSVLIIDDPVKNREEAESQTIREATKSWYSSTAYTRLAPGGGVLIILTRWHDSDLAGWLLNEMREAEKEAKETGEWPEDADRWRCIDFPAIATQYEKYRKRGEPLHEERYPLPALRKIKRALAPRDWSALYQQSPQVDEGAYFQKKHFKFFKIQPPYLDIYCAGDLAISKKEHADWTVFMVAGKDQDGQLYMLEEYRGRWDANEIVEKIFEIYRKWKPRKIGLEKGQISLTLDAFLQRRKREEKLHELYVEELPPGKQDKELRARTIQGLMSLGNVWWPEGALWVDDTMNELLRFPSGVNDDRVDAVAWIGKMVADAAYIGEGKPKAKKMTKSWRQKLAGYAQKSTFGKKPHMAS